MDHRDDLTALNGHRELAELLGAAAAPAHPHELRGQDAAVAAFRMARLEASRPVSPPAGPRPVPRRAIWARVLTLKAAAAGLVVAVGVGGVSVAAVSGVLPNPLSDSRPPSTMTDARTGGERTDGLSSGAQGARSPDTSASPGVSGSPDPAVTPDPAMVKICDDHKNFIKGWPKHRDKLPPGVADQLVAAAGGDENVENYCAAQLEAAQLNASPGPGESPGPSASSTPKPKKSDKPKKDG